jgi:hypothetical protein
MIRKVWFYHRLVDEEEVEDFCRRRLGNFDSLPPLIRYALNEAPEQITPAEARRMVRQYGVEEAARRILGMGRDEKA